MQLDEQQKVWGNTNLTATALSDKSYDQGTPGRHFENGKTKGLGVFVEDLTPGSTDTYEFQVVCADDEALSVNRTLVATTGAMANTDARIQAGASFFLPIPPNSVARQYVGGRFVGANTPNITLVRGDLMEQDRFIQIQNQPSNFTP